VIDDLERQRAQLATAFDRSFSLPFMSPLQEQRDFLVLRLGTHWYALPVEELAGVQNKKTIQFLPEAPPHCLGLAGVRGRLVAIYDLAALLGSAPSDRLSWFVQPKADPEIALLVPKAERYLRVPVASIVQQTEADDATLGALIDGGVAMNVLSVDRIVQDIRARHRAGQP
jgi:chemotaxis signal transduction protein